MTADMNDLDRRPGFLWDEGLSIRDMQRCISEGDDADRIPLLAKILREARDDQVWHFTTVQQIMDAWPRISPRLGRRRGFWEFLFDAWKRQGLVQ